MARRFIISFLLPLLCALPLGVFATQPYTVVAPTGVGNTDTINLILALNTCSSPKGVFITPGTLKLVSGMNVPDGCTITGSIAGSPTASANGAQNTVVDCSALTGTHACFTLGANSDTITGFTIIGNGSTAFISTNCIDNETISGGHEILHMVFRNCGVGVNIGAAGCCTQNVRVVDAAFQDNGTSIYCHSNCTDSYFSNLAVISPTSYGVYCGTGCTSTQWNHIAIQNNPATGIGLVFSQAPELQVTDVSVDGGTCIYLNGNSGSAGQDNVTFNGTRCAGDGGANEYCLQIDGPGTIGGVHHAIFTGLQCTGGYNGSGSAVISETNDSTIGNNCYHPCSIDVMWNGTDTLYNGTIAQTDLDFTRYNRGVSYVAQALGGTTFAAPDPSKGFNNSFAIAAGCSTPCTVPAPVVITDGQSGYFAFTQPTPAVTNPLVWNAAYKNTAQPLATSGKTTWFRWVAFGSAAVVLDTAFHN